MTELAAMPDALLPCPFCGGGTIGPFEQKYTSPEPMTTWGIVCDNTDCCCLRDGYATKEAAIKAWNRREAARRLAAPMGLPLVVMGDSPAGRGTAICHTKEDLRDAVAAFANGDYEITIKKYVESDSAKS